MKTFITILLSLLCVGIYGLIAHFAIQGFNHKDVKTAFWIFLGAVNLYGLAVMLIDKARAPIQGARRISERHLFLAACIGGAFGSFIGMRAARHKTKHFQFVFFFPAILIAEAIYTFMQYSNFAGK